MKRSLIYHLTPMGSWRKNIELLKPYLNIFNGAKIVAIAYGPGCEYDEAVNSVKKLFDVVISQPNDPELRETATLDPLLHALYLYVGAVGITFYGHTKGVTYTPQHKLYQATQLWTKLCYEKNLENPKAVEELFIDGKYNCVGAFKRHGTWTHFPPGSTWHYSGTFYWFRNNDLFKKDPDWEKKIPARKIKTMDDGVGDTNLFRSDTGWRELIPQHKYGAEAFPSLVWKNEEAACLFGDYCRNLYDIKYIKSLLTPAPKALGKNKPPVDLLAPTSHKGLWRGRYKITK